MTDSSPPEEAHDKAWENAERQFSHKTASQFYDPCQDFADRSLKCLKRNGYDREMCGDYFQAYRDCKKNWLNQKKAAPGSK
ncbi:Cytochrome c oxidase-assembly factor cox23 [Penicillium verhagenii]|nr:Cytochrome c oxidase-assembly factor cox23 [Penicillium verhagenii]